MEDLGFNNILGEKDINVLFSDSENSSAEEPAQEPESQGQEGKKNIETTATEVENPEDLFEGGEEGKQPESVGSEKIEEKEKEGSSPESGGGTSPKNFYSSMAVAVAEDGVFPNLDEETVKNANDAEKFSKLFDLEVEARLDEVQLRVKKALEDGVEPTDIRRYESTLQYVNSITDAQLSEESEKGEQLRKNIIYQDFLNQGYSPERARKFTERSIDGGSDVDDAKEALQSNKEYFQKQYNQLLKDAQDRAEAERAELKKRSERINKSIMEDKQLMGGMDISNDMRKKVVDSISKPVYKDPETGEYMTAIQKYEHEHPGEFLKYAGLIFTLTDGFKDFESFTKGKVKKEIRNGMRRLEQDLFNPQGSSGGSLRMITHGKDDPESFIARGLKLSI